MTIWRWAEGLEAHACPQELQQVIQAAQTREWGWSLPSSINTGHPPPQDSGLHNMYRMFQSEKQHQPLPFPPFLLKTLKILEKYFLPSFWFQASFCCSIQHATEANIPLQPNEIHFFF